MSLYAVLAVVSLSSSLALAQEDTTHWSLTREMVLRRDGTPSADAALLWDTLPASGDSTKIFTRNDFLALLSRSPARMIYAGIVNRYATPLADSITKTQHENYAKVFLHEKSQKAGLRFFKTHATALRGAQARYGVLQKDIVALLMWESGLGKYTGDYRIFNVFVGQMFFLDSARAEMESAYAGKGEKNPLDDPDVRRHEDRRLAQRKKDATTSLLSMLAQSKRMKIDPLSIKGSWGGAIGFVQFLPYNLRYAVDADGNGIDLKSWPDAIYSVARYLKERGGYRNTPSRRRRALMSYNASPEYAEGIMTLADTLWRRHRAGE